MSETSDAALRPHRQGPGQGTAFLWFVVVFALVVVIPVVAFQVASSHEVDRCASEHPDGECDLAGVAGIAAVLLVYVAETVLACAGFVVWLCFRLARRRNR